MKHQSMMFFMTSYLLLNCSITCFIGDFSFNKIISIYSQVRGKILNLRRFYDYICGQQVLKLNYTVSFVSLHNLPCHISVRVKRNYSRNIPKSSFFNGYGKKKSSHSIFCIKLTNNRVITNFPYRSWISEAYIPLQ